MTEEEFWEQVQTTHIFVTLTYRYHPAKDALLKDVSKYLKYLGWNCLGRHITAMGYYDVQPQAGEDLHIHLFIEVDGGLNGLTWKKDTQVKSWDEIESKCASMWNHGIAHAMPYFERKGGITYAHLFHEAYFHEHQVCPTIVPACKRSHKRNECCSHNRERQRSRQFHSDRIIRKVSL